MPDAPVVGAVVCGVGIATGFVTLGRIGFEGCGDCAVVGSVVNLCARLCAQAEDGQILLTRAPTREWRAGRPSAMPVT